MIEIKNLNKTYDARSRHAQKVLRDLSLTLPDTGFVCILGPSGCGKTTLLNAVGGLDGYDGGEISVNGTAVTRFGANSMQSVRNRSFGYIFQNYYLLEEHSVGYNVYLGLHNLDLTHREKLERVRQALQAVDMARYSRRLVSSLSGGQQQRVAIARALARRPRVIFADEPTGNLDEANTMNICTLLRQISKQSLVVMVTHEERIARFFADRILTVEAGRIGKDETEWERGSMALQDGDSRFYAGDYEESTQQHEGFSFRLLRDPAAKELKFTILALPDRIVLQLDDHRSLTLSDTAQPMIAEGCRPRLTLEEIDRSDLHAQKLLPDAAEERRSVPGKGIGFSMIGKEALRLWRTAGIRQLGIWVFLVTLTVLTIWIVGDFMTLSRIDPEDFIRTDSHIFSFTMNYGENASPSDSYADLSARYIEYLEKSGLDITVMPVEAYSPTYSTDIYAQLGKIEQPLGKFSYVLLDRFDESTLIAGRMPEYSDEIVIDRRVLQNLLDKDGVLQSGITDIQQFLGVELVFSKKNAFTPTIVGISDSGEHSLYLSPAAMISIASGGKPLIGFEEFIRRYPEKEGLFDLTPDEDGQFCLINLEQMGSGYAYRVGVYCYIVNGIQMRIQGTFSSDDCAASFVINDDQIERIARQIINRNFNVYAADPAAFRAYIAKPSEDQENKTATVIAKHEYSAKMDEYTEQSRIKADARLIVTVTVIALAMVMLYLLQRSRVHGRIGMLAVYRLLGIPGRKLLCIFALESFLLSLTSSLPAAAATYGVFTALTNLTSTEFSMYLPWYAAALVYLATLVYQMLVSLLPAWRLLCLRPARLASKYDF